MKVKSALEESEKRYRTLMEQAAEAIFVHGINGQVVDVNQQACISLGYTREELLSMNIADIDAEATENKKGGLFWPKVLAGQSVTFKSKMKRGDGNILPVEVTLGPITLGKEIFVIGFSRDITERTKAEDALRTSEAKYRELINGMNDTAWVIDFDANFIDVNDAAVKVLGYSREELLSMGPTDIDNSLSREQIRDLVKRMPADQIQVFETAHTTKDGKTIPVEISSSLVTYHGKQAVLGIARDITERKKMMNALRESEEKYRRQFEEASDAIFVADAETGILVTSAWL
jgi:PAS domain S-box-containing protein